MSRQCLHGRQFTSARTRCRSMHRGAITAGLCIQPYQQWRFRKMRAKPISFEASAVPTSAGRCDGRGSREGHQSFDMLWCAVCELLVFDVVARQRACWALGHPSPSVTPSPNRYVQSSTRNIFGECRYCHPRVAAIVARAVPVRVAALEMGRKEGAARTVRAPNHPVASPAPWVADCRLLCRTVPPALTGPIRAVG